MWRCPRCKSTIRIFEACTTILVYDNGTEVDDCFEWDDENEAECTQCSWKGTAGEAFQEDEGEELEEKQEEELREEQGASLL